MHANRLIGEAHAKHVGASPRRQSTASSVSESQIARAHHGLQHDHRILATHPANQVTDPGQSATIALSFGLFDDLMFDDHAAVQRRCR